MDTRNVILTGLQRSGTTLACHLLNKLDDTVALDEPMSVGKLTRLGGAAFVCGEVKRFFGEMRRSLLAGGTAISKHLGGQVPDNHIGARTAAGEARESFATRGLITADKPLTEDFVLCIKHPSVFTAALAELSKGFPCYAMVRNPLPVMLSWNSVSFPVTEGHVPAAERLRPELAAKLAKMADPLDRQVCILDWFFATYDAVLPASCIIRYEDLVASGGAALAVVRAEAARLGEKLENKNRNPFYDRKLIPVLGQALLESEGAYWKFYSRESVEELLGDWGGRCR